MLLSLITPTFNSARTLRDTLDSVARQNCAALEHWVVDGGSTDGTLDIAAEYPHLTGVVPGPDRGLYDAMNKGVVQARGEIVGILNSDDRYAHPGVLRKVIKAFQETGADAVYGDLRYVSDQHPDRTVRYWKAGAYRRHNFLYGWMPPHPTFFVRRALYERHGGFDLSLRNSADYELMLRFLYCHHASVAYIPEVLVDMRTGGISNASWRHRLRANQEDREAWRRNGLRPFFFTSILKPLRKAPQFLFVK